MTLLNVEGMSCAHCVRAVTEAIQRLDPNAEVTVNLAAGTVLTHSAVSHIRLADAITAEGYTVLAAT